MSRAYDLPRGRQPLDLGNNLRLVEFVWSSEDGDCYDCGLPAAFWSAAQYGATRDEPEPEDLLCAVCAANVAADGFAIDRIENLS